MEIKFSAQASIAYLKTVLGIESFILPADFSPVAVSHSGPVDSDFAVVVAASIMTESTSKLLERMLAAMKRSADDTLTITISENSTPDQVMPVLAEYPRKSVLVFGEMTGELLSGGKRLPMAQWLAPLPEVPVLLTHGLDEIETQPELKKIVWQHLQMAMQKLGGK